MTNGTSGTMSASVDRRYQQITPTSVPLSKIELNPKTRLELLRAMEAEQGFAMRPLPRGSTVWETTLCLSQSRTYRAWPDLFLFQTYQRKN